MQEESRIVPQERKETRNNHNIELFMRKCMQYLHIRYEFNRNLFCSEFFPSHSLYIGTQYFTPEGFDKNKLPMILQRKFYASFVNLKTLKSLGRENILLLLVKKFIDMRQFF